MALNGSLVRKVEGEEAQIKDVPSLKRKSSHPSFLNGCLKGRKRAGGEERGVFVLEKGERASAIQPPGRQEGCRDAGIFRTAPYHMMPRAACACTACSAYRHKESGVYKHLHPRTVNTRVHIKVNAQRKDCNCLCKYSFHVSRVFKDCMGCDVGGAAHGKD